MYKNPEFFEQLSALTKNVLPLIDPAIKRAFLPKQFDKYPNLEYSKTGFPQISNYPSRTNIFHFFHPPYQGKDPEINLKNFKEYEWLIANFTLTSKFSDYFRFPNRDIDQDITYQFMAGRFIEEFIERYYYLYGEKYSTGKFSKVYLPVENYLFADTIHFDIAIPILFLKFAPNNFELSTGIYLRKISDEDQRARYGISAYSPSIPDSLYMSATHELVLKDYTYKRPNTFYDYFHFSDPHIYPLAIVEKFITILKLVTDETSGFAQLLVYPKNWAIRYNADIKHIDGAVTKSYPHYFENFYWNRESFPEITLIQLNEIKRLYNKSDLSPDNKVQISLKRLYKSMMRQEEEDVIIDLIIALELLLSDNEKNDISYKLSMRLTALICKYNPQKYKKIEVFENIKKIYDFRSAVVHGSPKRAHKSREIKLADDSTIPTIELAKLYLREVLKIVIAEPKHLEAKTNDLLLLTSFNSKGK